MDIHWPETSGWVALAADETHVWAVPLQYDLSQIALSGVLSVEECKRAERFRVDEPRQRFVIARAALRTMLGLYLDVPPIEIALTEGANGKPRLTQQDSMVPLQFNVAHSDELALVAVTAGCEVGVDVERLRTVGHWEGITRRYFHDAEALAIVRSAPSDRMRAFLKCWTAKEAVLKALGLGLSGSLTDFQVPIEDRGGQWLRLPPESRAPDVWLQSLAPHNDYVGAVATVGEQRRIRGFTFQWRRHN